MTSVQEQQHAMISMEHMRAMFAPSGVAVVGATERAGSVGRTVVENLMSGYKDMTSSTPFELYPVNPTRDTVLGLKCYPAVSAIDTGKCELVVVITPASRCNDVVKDCTQNKSVKVIVVIAAGFKEVGPEGLALEQELVKTASDAGIAVVGPNCLGVMSPNHYMNATFAADSAKPGHVAFLSQSGAMCTAVLDWALQVGLGFSAFVSLGSMAHIDWARTIEYLGNDDKTNAILLYMETIGNAKEFMRSARKVSTKKPIIVIKAGKTAAAAAAAVSHTGSLAGSHDSFVAAMRTAGCLVVATIDELQNIAMLTAMQPKPTGNDLIIVTNAGGPGVLSTDAAAIAGLNVVDLDQKLVTAMNDFLPAAWSHHNPVDVLGDAKADCYAKCVEVIFDQGPAGCSMLVVLSPQSVTEPVPTAEAIIKCVQAKRMEKTLFNGPVVCAFMGGKAVEEARNKLIAAGIPTFAQPDIAAQAIALLCKQVAGAHQLSEVPAGSNPTAKQQALDIMSAAMKEGRTGLTETESKAVFKGYGVPVAESIICESADAAVVAASGMGYPCVIKLHSETITHKSDVGGVKLNIRGDDAVRKSFEEIKTNVEKIGPHHFQGVSVQPMLDIGSGVELLVGSTVDNQFGPMVMFGTGGCMVEVFRDTCVSVPPLSSNASKSLIDATKISKALVPGHGERFKGCPVHEVQRAVENFSVMVCDLYECVAECEINPLLALPDRVIALDARIVLKAKEAPAHASPCLLF